jgi:glutathione S-transferase
MPNPIKHQANVLSSVLTSTLNKWRGCMVLPTAVAGVQPPLPLRLFDIEASPWCRAVREVFTALHLDVEIYPCPKGGTRFRPEAERLGGKQLFPLLVDPNTDTVMHESQDIIDYLFATYGGRRTPRAFQGSRLKPAFSVVSSAARGLRGLRVRPARQPEQLLDLWSFEGSPYSRLVRERLCEMEIPYTLHSMGKEHWLEAGPATRRLKPGPYVPTPGGKRAAFFAEHGTVQVPYLEDPNTGVKMFESSDIIDYLEASYAG